MKTFEYEAEKLKKELERRRRRILKRQEEYYRQHGFRGLDGNPYAKELRAETEWFFREMDKIRKRYGKTDEA